MGGNYFLQMLWTVLNQECSFVLSPEVSKKTKNKTFWFIFGLEFVFYSDCNWFNFTMNVKRKPLFRWVRVCVNSEHLLNQCCLLQGFALRKVLLQNYLYNNKKNIKAELVEHGGGNFFFKCF